ncbi:hypothetical protein K2173_005525 [Erythroxylum novogranatense]|uniref:Uncharacterized protein n=1 Tax=Erythroxylum novogranatense TaxID=1862640 RepID=A0AAV8SK40_9ROSI|nr:hypothetical protein K2173_005525 [Erythroxylum novogranatense]
MSTSTHLPRWNHMLTALFFAQRQGQFQMVGGLLMFRKLIQPMPGLYELLLLLIVAQPLKYIIILILLNESTSRCSEMYGQKLIDSLSMDSDERPYKMVVSEAAAKMLEAPNVSDDFYANVMDWGKNNIVVAALASALYFWSAETCKVEKKLMTLIACQV